MKTMHKHAGLLRLTAMALCLCMTVSMFAGISAPRLARAEEAAGGPTQGVKRQADPSTMDTYTDVLDIDKNSRHAGRVWADKTVFAYGNASQKLTIGDDNTSSLSNESDWHVDGETGKSYLQLNTKEDGVDAQIDLNEDFLHVFSVLGSTQNINTERARPLDVVLLLDISSSMTSGQEIDNSALTKTLSAANELITKLMNESGDVTIHTDNRVGVVVYGGGAQVLLPLRHYTRVSDSAHSGEYIWDNPTGRVARTSAGGGYFSVITTNVNGGVDNGAQRSSKVMLSDSTYLQAALYQGMYMLATAQDITVKDANGKEVARQPILITLTDGATNIVGATSTGTRYENSRQTFSTNPTNIQFWDPLGWAHNQSYTENSPNQTVGPMNKHTSVIVPRIVNTRNNNENYAAPNANPIYIPDSAADTISAVGPRTTAVLLTAGYMKNWVEANYTKAAGEKVNLRGFGIGLNIDGYENGKLQWAQLYGTMDPRNYVVPDRTGTSDGETQLKDVYSNIVEYINNPTGSIERAFDPNYTWVGGTRLTAQWTFSHPNGDTDDSANGNSAYDVTSVDDVYYIDQFYNATTENIDEIFNQITEEITTAAFTPVGGENDLGVEDSVTYVDPVGKYMEIKDVDSLTLFGERYELVKAGVYDYQFNDEYMKYDYTQNDYEDNQLQPGVTLFPRGWYHRDENDIVPETGLGKIQPYYKDYTDRANKLPEGYATADLAREDGWEYYFDAKTAQQFASTLPESGVSGMDEKQQNTLYTFYRFEIDRIGTDQDEHERLMNLPNPSYGTLPSDETKARVTFNLNDIRIWDEDTGDYDDPLIEHGGLMTNVGYDDALYINIPVEALPVRVATIDVHNDSGNETYTYSTNVGDTSGKASDLPLRVYYSVGLRDDLTNADGEIDLLAGVNNEYLNTYKVTTANKAKFGDEVEVGDVLFYANWYNETNRYKGYASSETSDGYTYGDPAITFSPSTDNSYYIAQEPLPIFLLKPDEQKKYEGSSSRPEELVMFDTRTAKALTDVAEQVTENNDTQLDPNKWYYVVANYYVKREDGTATRVYRAVPRKGSEFGSGIAGLEGLSKAYLCWHNDNLNLSYDLTGAEEHTNKPEEGEAEDWHIALKAGALRTGDFALNIRPKNGEYDQISGEGVTPVEGYYTGNTTRTANNYYLPVISDNRSTSATGGVIFNAYLGNNGRLWFSDSLLAVGKTVEPAQNSSGANTGGTFNYQMYVKNWTGLHTANVLMHDDENGLDRWMRQAHYIDLVLGNNLCLRDTNDFAARFDADGKRVVSTDDGGWVYAENGEPYIPKDSTKEPYYIYLGANTDASDVGNTGRNTFRVMHTAHDKYSGEVTGIKAVSDPSDPARISYYATNAWLIPADSYNTWESVPSTPPETEDDKGDFPGTKIEEDLLLLSFAPAKVNSRESTWQFEITSAYKTDSAYLTKDVYFGKKAGGAEDLTAADLYDQSPNFAAFAGQDLAGIAGNTAEFTLEHRQGLLFSGIEAGTVYRVTEKLLDDQINEDGVGIKRVEHTTAAGNKQVYALGGNIPQSMRIDNGTHAYSVFGGAANEFERFIHYVNTSSTDKQETEINGDKIEEPSGSLKPHVEVGDKITYTISWKNTAADEAHVFVVDKLDDGVDFVSASYGNIKLTEETDGLIASGEATADSGAYSGPVTIRYYDANTPYEYQYVDPADSQTKTKTMNHVVTWDFGENVPNDATGTVTLTVRVNSRAKRYWDYESPTPSPGTSRPRPEEGDDSLVRNRAEVHVADNTYYTNIVQNPLDEPSKTETLIDPDPNKPDDELEVKEGTNLDRTPREGQTDQLDGPTVMVGDRITYRITWRNGENKEAVITVRDVLDPNVRFVSATFSPSSIKPAIDEDTYGGAQEATLTPALSDTGDTPEKPENAETLDKTVTDTAGKEVPIIRYFKETQNPSDPSENPPYNVEWNLGTQAAGTEGYVELTVEVLPGAVAPPYEVVNTAYAAVDNRWMQTEEVHNPVPEFGKTETDPGPNKMVGIGEPIHYEVNWVNERNTSARVVVTDKLDPGVTFTTAGIKEPVSGTSPAVERIVDTATANVVNDRTRRQRILYYEVPGSYTTYLADGTPAAKIEIYAHTVVWDLGVQAARTDGTVTLDVEVNENAKIKYEYNGDATDFTGSGDEQDFEVRNQARVLVENDARVTNEVDNPVPDKTEVKEPELEHPGEGEQVQVGQEIKYSVHWWNDQTETATVYVIDPLDKGADFVRASYGDPAAGGVTLTRDEVDASSENVVTSEPGSDGTTISYYKEKGDLTDAAGNTETVPARTVVWVLPDRPAMTVNGDGSYADNGSSGDVELIVEVNENAVKTWTYGPADEPNVDDNTNDYEVLNRAKVQVGKPANDAHYTSVMENTLDEKTEVHPGDGVPVGIGEQIDYDIRWHNDSLNEDGAYIVITDTLDPGVDFVSAQWQSASGKLYVIKVDEDGNLDTRAAGTVKDENGNDVPVIQYKPPEDASSSGIVTWTIGKQDKNAAGSVQLSVKVNENAKVAYAYTEPDPANPDTMTPGTEPDYKVLDRAVVSVDHEPHFTNIVENPVSEKTEVSPGDGVNVRVGEDIVYEIHWKNTTNKQAYVVVTDTLDPGVTFKDATSDTKEAGSDDSFKKGVYYPTSRDDIPTGDGHVTSIAPRTVVWDIGEVGPDEEGTVTLTVTVNADARLLYEYTETQPQLPDNMQPGAQGETDYKVVDRAKVIVDNEPHFTNRVENPIDEKKELTPGEGEIVGVGTQIEYEIDWRNDLEKAAWVVVYDPLDPGVDYESNVSDVQTTDETGKGVYVSQPVTLTRDGYDPVTIPAHAVYWDFGVQEPGNKGAVKLTVKVNKNANVTYDYTEDSDTLAGGSGMDYKVTDRATIVVGNEPHHTNEVQNPLNEKREVTPGDGEAVKVGDPITYQIDWKNDTGEAAYVVVTDTLDLGVTYVSASADPPLAPSRIAYYEKESAIPTGPIPEGETQPPTAQVAARTVVWDIGMVDAGAHGTLTLNVTVNEHAKELHDYAETDAGKADTMTNPEDGETDYKVVDRAKVSVGNQWHFTNRVENPLKEKEETTPGDGKSVLPGDEITYTINWEGPAGSYVVVTDKLDPGVEFVSAKWEGYTLTAEEDGSLGGSAGDRITYAGSPWTLRYTLSDGTNVTEDIPGHAVVWNIGIVGENTSGTVTLTVRVKADGEPEKDYDYGETDPKKPDDMTGGSGTDNQVVNRAKVTVDNTPHFTNKVSNPFGGPDKTETKIDRDPYDGIGDINGGVATMALDVRDPHDVDVSEGDLHLKPDTEDTYVGPRVFPGDRITYEISWENYKSEPAPIVIRDPLDPNVRFVSAAFYRTDTTDSAGTPYKEEELPENSAPSDNLTINTTDDAKPNVSEDLANSKNKVSYTYTQDGTNVQYDGSVISYKYTAASASASDSAEVTWHLGVQPEGSKGKVRLIVQVLSTATPVGHVDNHAFVQVGNDAEQQTRTLENPTPSWQKEEKPYDEENVDNLPYEDDQVQVGKPIHYEIEWYNNNDKPQVVTITDPLDKGVDFTRAWYGDANAPTVLLTAQDVEAGKLTTGPVAVNDNGVDFTVEIAYSDHTVTWTLGDAEEAANKGMPAFSGGYVELDVTVNEQAVKTWTYGVGSDGQPDDEKNGEGNGKDYGVVNRAKIQVGDVKNEGEVHYTPVVENPVPEKTELTPGPDIMVSVGETVTYNVHWENRYDKPARVIITDPLDDGADFLSASFDGVTLGQNQTEARGKDAYGDVVITYDPLTRTVVWTLEDRPAGSSGDVALQITVNEKAYQTWTYEPDQDAGKAGEGDDFEIVNRARVQVGDRGAFTSEIENPVPDKQETTPGADQPVVVGQEIVYEIYWKNGHDKEADVLIEDTLDVGLTFKSASDGGTYDPRTRTVTWKLPKQPAKAQGHVMLTVKVNDRALQKGVVENTADVKIGDDPKARTRVIRNPTKPKDVPDIPMTGDESRPGLWAALALLCAAAMAGTVTLGKRKRDK